METTKDLFDLNNTIACEYLEQYSTPWSALDGIKDYIISLGQRLDSNEYIETLPNVWIHKTAHIYSNVYLGSPCIIGKNTEVRHGAFVRSSALIGDNCVIGNSVELKNVIIFNNASIAHFNYVGDSILGYKAHMGAGAITSNVKLDKTSILIKGDDIVKTNRRKMGAMIGDFSEIGCNTVLNPGTIICKNVCVYPLSNIRGVIPANCIVKSNNVIVSKELLE